MEGLHALARSGDISQLAVAIAKAGTTAKAHRSKNHPLEARDKHGRTALMLAAYEGHVEVLELLVAEGVSGHQQYNIVGTVITRRLGAHAGAG